MVDAPNVAKFPKGYPVGYDSFVIAFFLTARFAPNSDSSAMSVEEGKLQYNEVSVVYYMFVVSVCVCPFSVHSGLSAHFTLGGISQGTRDIF